MKRYYELCENGYSEADVIRFIKTRETCVATLKGRMNGDTKICAEILNDKCEISARIYDGETDSTIDRVTVPKYEVAFLLYDGEPFRTMDGKYIVSRTISGIRIDCEG